MTTYPQHSKAELSAIAAILPRPGQLRPLGYEDADETEMRELHATSWLNIGLSSPKEVSPWIEAGVHSAIVARDAIRLGYQPSDPWVRRSSSEFAMPERLPLTPPTPRVAAANRRQARKAWKREQAENAARAKRIQAQFADAAQLVRSQGIGSGFSLAGLEFLEIANSTATPTDVVAAFDEFSVLLNGIKREYANGELDPSELREICEHTKTYVQLLQRSVHVLPHRERATIQAALLDAAAWLSAPE